MRYPPVVCIIEENPELTLEELCLASAVTPELVQEIIEYGVITPLSTARFSTVHLRQVRTIAHLQRDLGVNLAGAAVVLDLMEQLEDMRSQMELLRKYLR